MSLNTVDDDVKRGLTLRAIAEENAAIGGAGSRGTSQGEMGRFVPCFRCKTTGEVFFPLDANGNIAPIHLLNGIPERFVTSRGLDGGALSVCPDIESGFYRDGQFYTRKEAAEY